jgi:quercetin dioxygenase-like cupin family protein
MRLVVIGIDPGGQSLVERIDELGPDAGPPANGLLAQEIWASPANRKALDSRPRTATLRPLACEPGEVSWKFVTYQPDASVDMHRTDTLDCDVVLRGRIELGLETGSIELLPGDLVLIPGLAHRWRAGSEGAMLSAVLVGLGR